MKLFLASFIQREYFGPGRIISVARGEKPRGLDVANIYLPFVPDAEVLAGYNEKATPPVGASDEEVKALRAAAGAFFEEKYKAQLEVFVQKVLAAAAEENKKPEEILPFQEGDTLCSWERSFNTHYRKTLASYIERLGFEVVQN